MTRVQVVLLCLAVVGCSDVRPPPVLPDLSSFKVEVKGVFVQVNGARSPLDVTSPCVARYGSQAKVPASARGTKDCPYAIARGEVEIDVVASARDRQGAALPFNGPVSFRVLPGDLSGDLSNRWGTAVDGVVTTTVHASHQYGDVRVWAEDAPPAAVYDAGVAVTAGLPVEPAQRTYAAGASDVVHFDDQTLQSLKLTDGFDNRSSPFVGEFVSVGKNPESGETLTQSCSDDPARNGKPSLMVVTGLDPSGFFVSDVSACRLIEKTADSAGVTQVRTQEPPERCLVTLSDAGVTDIEGSGVGSGTCEISRGACTARTQCKHYLPSTFAHMFVYNYNFPDGLDEGDLIFTLSGSVQEFTSTTQMVFPAWSVAEHVRQLPPDQWNKWLQYAPPTVINYRVCGMDDTVAPFLTDALCGHNKRNLKMESVESGLVRLNNVRFPTEWDNCDFNADGQVPFFCESKDPDGNWIWTSCAFNSVEPDNDRKERECHQACVIGTGVHDGKICAEESTFKGFGQFVVELGMPGPAQFGLDDSLTQRSTPVPIPLAADGGVENRVVRVDGYGLNQEVMVACDQDVAYRAGDSTVVAEATDAQLAGGHSTSVKFGANQTSVSLRALGTSPAKCWVGLNVKARINLLTKDAIPEINPDCREDDSDADRALQCKQLHAATFDVIGHARHVQPARPRWMVIPRSVDDVCCHPASGQACPKPIKACQ